MNIEDVLYDFCVKLNANKNYKVDDLLPKYFKGMEQSELLNHTLTFSEKFTCFTKILRPVVDKLKPKMYTVYLLECNGLVVYVGKSSDVCSRLNTHAKDKEFDQVSIITLLDESSQSLCENSLILKYLPKYNKNLNISDATINTDFECNKVSLIDWLNSAVWFTKPTSELQKKLGLLILPKDFLVFKGVLDYLYYKTEYSCVLSEKHSFEEKPAVSKGSIESQLKEAANLTSRPELFSVVTRGVYRFGKYYITDRGRWRVEGSSKWYSNVNVNVLVKEIISELISSASVSDDPVPLWFGKYKGKLYSELLSIDPDYCNWMKAKLSKLDLSRIIGNNH